MVLTSAFFALSLSDSLLFDHSYPALAAENAEYTEGMNAYQKADYKGAVAHFSKSIQNGNKSANVYLFNGHALSRLYQFQRAYQRYEAVTKLFKGTPEAKTAAELMVDIKPKLGQPAVVVPNKPTGLMARIIVTPPMFKHPAVSRESIAAAQQAIAALPPAMRAKLDASDARVIISPNMIDRWPESLKDLPESDPAPNLAEMPGRIYGRDMCVYERAKKRGTTALKEARPPLFIRLQVGNMCFQVLDDMLTLSKDPACRKEWERDKSAIPERMVPKLATFMKTDDWGPRETCSELFGSMLGGRDENTNDLYRYFPHTKQWLITKMGIKTVR